MAILAAHVTPQYILGYEAPSVSLASEMRELPLPGSIVQGMRRSLLQKSATTETLLVYNRWTWLSGLVLALVLINFLKERFIYSHININKRFIG